MDYATDKQWSDQHLPELKKIVAGVVGPLLKIAVSESDVKVDQQQATDLIPLIVGPKSYAARLRRPGFFWAKQFAWSTPWGLQFTIRSRRDSGAETELGKIKRGYADILFYGHVENGFIRHWAAIDLNVFRRHESSPGTQRAYQSNNDGTHFVAYSIKSFPDELIIEASPTMARAIELGVDAVEPLKTQTEFESEERWKRRYASDPPPNLQELVTRFGGYNKIPQEAFYEYDRAMAAWQRRRRYI